MDISPFFQNITTEIYEKIQPFFDDLHRGDGPLLGGGNALLTKLGRLEGSGWRTGWGFPQGGKYWEYILEYHGEIMGGVTTGLWNYLRTNNG
jgi:hypothetical protein